MKIHRHGKSAPVSREIYRKVRPALPRERDRLALDIAFFTGERWGAISRLQVDDCWDSRRHPRREITFRASTRKDGKTRQVPVVEELDMRLRLYSPPAEGWLFPSPSPRRKDRHITLRALTYSLEKALRTAGLHDMGISSHGTRHNFISSLHGAGYSLAYIKELTGHSNLNSLNHYIAINPAGQAKAIENALR